jgi:hypothetical protein
MTERYSTNDHSSFGGLRGESPKEERLRKHREAIIRPGDFSGDSGGTTGNSVNLVINVNEGR